MKIKNNALKKPKLQVDSPYPRPDQVGGRLIRKAIAQLKQSGEALPIDTDILIAVSGGADSVALAHLLVHYGRRVGAASRIRLLHVNHGWRGKDSDQDAEFVQSLGAKWGVPVIVRKVSPPRNTSKSWEEDARDKRKAVFEKEAAKYRATVFTAHQADDLAETLIWRLFTGAATTHGAGIFCRVGVEVRPFLNVRKKELEAYLQECCQSYREDSTNASPRFMRARIRKSIMPAIEEVFPRAVEHLVSAALAAQQPGRSVNTGDLQEEQKELLQSSLFRAAGLKVRRSQWELILQKGVAKKDWSGEIHLPDGWKLTCSQSAGQKTDPISGQGVVEMSKKWVLERT
jgi:tRNA(Ile)-lysidine synthetase-like protein